MKIEIKETKDWLRSRDIEGGEIATILSEGNIVEKEFEKGKKKVVLELDVEINKKRYTWTLNKTTLRKIINKWGDETKKWIGKKIKLKKVKVLVRGEEKESIIGEPLEETQKGEEKEVEVIKI